MLNSQMKGLVVHLLRAYLPLTLDLSMAASWVLTRTRTGHCDGSRVHVNFKLVIRVHFLYGSG